jgi:hypothetical protein
VTEVLLRANTLTLRVTNAPGIQHAQLIDLPHPSVIFERGKRLHHASVDDDTNRVSSGDGGWIMHQCARALGGECSIRFDAQGTTFELVCPITPPRALCAGAGRADGGAAEVEFALPADVVCIGIDDSKVQRFILRKMFAALGADPGCVEIYGEHDAHLLNVAGIVVEAVRVHPEERVLVIADENLELADGCASMSVLSSSEFHKVRAELDDAEMARLLLVIRSANDSRSDLARYLRSAHAVLPKRGFAKEAIFLSIAPMWRARFAPVSPSGSSGSVAAGPEAARSAMSKSRSMNSLDQIRCGVSDVVGKLCHEITAMSTPWHKAKRSLVTIKGELASLNAVSGGCEEQLALLVRQVEAVLEGDEASFRSTWPDLLGAINGALARTCAE